jgi:hypothetical protein
MITTLIILLGLASAVALAGIWVCLAMSASEDGRWGDK